MLYSSGTTGRPKGVKRPLPGDDRRPTASRCARQMTSTASRRTRSTCRPRRSITPRRWAGDDGAGARRHGGGDGALRRRAGAAADREVQGHHSQWVPTMFVRMLKLPAEARAKPTTSRRCSRSLSTPPRPARSSQAADDRMVGADHQRVLRRHRGQRLRPSSTAPSGWPTRARSASARSAMLQICDEEGERAAAGEEGLVYFERRQPVRVPQRPEEDRARAAPAARTGRRLGDVG